VLENVLTAAVICFIGVRLLSGARTATSGAGRQTVLRVVRGIRWRHVWPAPLVLTGVVAVAMVLMLVPPLDWGWWTALGGTGNPITGGTEQTAGTVLEWLVPAVFVVLLLPALPLFALTEERMFRAGAEDWSWRRRAFKALQFGCAHVLIGIPIGVALALSLGGAYFQAVYLRAFRRSGLRSAAVLESTRAHTAYNATIIAIVALALAAYAAGL
jgi:hypothetical protein